MNKIIVSTNSIDKRSINVRKLNNDIPISLVRLNIAIIIIIFIIILLSIFLIPFPYSKGESIFMHLFMENKVA